MLAGEIKMGSRPLPILAAIVLLLFEAATNLPIFWESLFPGVEEPPAFFIYTGYVAGVACLVAAVGLWLLRPWSFWVTLIVALLNLLMALPGPVLAPPEIRGVIALTAVAAILIAVLVALPASRRALAPGDARRGPDRAAGA